MPYLFRSILSKNRKSFAINACISKNKPIIAKFKILSGLSGIENDMPIEHQDRMKFESGNNTIETIYVPCFSLNTILRAINITQIDYFSLDVEGAELNVINSIDFERIDIKSLTIEHNGYKDRKEKIMKFFNKINYKISKTDGQDIYLIKTK